MSETKAAIFPSLSAAQKNVVRSYHIRTAAFWNVIVSQLSDFSKLYIEETEGSVSDEALEQMMDMLFEILINKNTELMPGYVIPAELANELSLACQLPEQLLRNRIMDIMQSFKAAKQNYRQGRGTYPLPGMKSNRSNHTVRFERGDFEIKGDIITFNGRFKLSIQDVKIARYDNSKVKSVSLSRKKVGNESRARLGLGKEARVYCLTFLIENAVKM